MQHQTKTTMRLACLVAVLLVGSAWPCSANAHVTEADEEFIRRSWETKPRPTYSKEDVPTTLRIAEAARRFVVLAEIANKLTAGAAEHVTELRARAKTAVSATTQTAAEAETIAESTKTFAAQKAAQDAKMAAEVAKELYGKAPIHPEQIQRRIKLFGKRHGEAKRLESALGEAIKALEENSGKEGDATQLVSNVMKPARNMLKLARNAEYDAKYIAQKRLFTELLAERVGIMQGLAEDAKKRAESSTDGTEESCANKGEQRDAAEALRHRQPAVKAYLHALAAQKIAAECNSHTSKNATKIEKTYQVLKGLLAKTKGADNKKLQLYRGIADEAHTNADEFKRVAATASQSAATHVQEAKTALGRITSCVSEGEATRQARTAHKASKSALNEMQSAMYQLFGAIVSLQQVTDAKLAVESSNAIEGAETEAAVTGPKADEAPERVAQPKRRALERYAGGHHTAAGAHGRARRARD